jgi:hypothetical protein
LDSTDLIGAEIDIKINPKFTEEDGIKKDYIALKLHFYPYKKRACCNTNSSYGKKREIKVNCHFMIFMFC